MKNTSTEKIAKTSLILTGLLAAAWSYPYLDCLAAMPDTCDSDTQNSNWMKNIDDNTNLSKINIPGTHDSGTCYVQNAYLTKCQVIPIAKQLECGYRYLDIRLAPFSNKLYLMHADAHCKVDIKPWSKDLELSDVLSDCYAFLDKHPSETILFSVKYEAKEKDIEAFQTLLHQYIDKDEDRWLLTDSMPDMKDARSKIVLIRRYADTKKLNKQSGIPTIWKVQEGQENAAYEFGDSISDSLKLAVQDCYEYDAQPKLDVFKRTLNAANRSEDTLIINFLSCRGSRTIGHPYAFAKVLNPQLEKLDLDKNKYIGCIVVDFGGTKEAKKIYTTNF